MKTLGLLSRVAEVMAPESQGVRDAARSAEDAGYSAVSLSALPLGLNLSAGMANQLNGSMAEISRADLGNVSKGIPSDAPMPQRDLSRDSGMSLG
ncbi:MAG: hypothetical protein ACK502_01610 [Alphaproteobacteria bacterium]